jgi:hypothetical protein
MPILNDTRKIIDLTLPSDPEATVQIRDGLLVGDVKAIEEIPNKTDQSLAMLEKMIVSWNFTDADGKALPATASNLAKLEMKDLEYIMTNVTFVKDFLAQQDKSNKQ